MLNFFLKYIFFLLGFFRSFFVVINTKTYERDVSSVIFSSAFGHKITNLDYLARIFKNNKVLVFWIKYNETNNYLLEIYSNYLSYVFINLISRNFSKNNDILSYEGLGIQKGLNFFLSFSNNNYHITDSSILYKMLNPFNERMQVYDFKNNLIKKKYDTFYSHEFLINKISLNDLGLNKNSITTVKNFLEKNIDINNLKIAYFLFRNERHNYTEKHDILRDSGNIKNYKAAIIYLLENNYSVFYSGSDKLLLDNNIYKNFFDLDKADISSDLLNIYLLLHSDFIVSQHSGPIHLCNIFKTPIVFTDFLPLWQGSCGEKDIFLPKKFYDRVNNREVSLKQIFIDYKKLFFGAYDYYKNIDILDSSESDILDAVTEMNLQLFDKEFSLNSIEDKLNNYYDLVPKPSLHHMRKNRITIKKLKENF